MMHLRHIKLQGRGRLGILDMVVALLTGRVRVPVAVKRAMCAK
jgi:hypothetical protein